MTVTLPSLLLTAALCLLCSDPARAMTVQHTPNSPSTTVLDVNAGYLYIDFDQAFQSALSLGGVVYSFHGTVDAPAGVITGARGFRIYGGLCDITDGVGEFQTVGDIQFQFGSNILEIRHLTMDTSGQLPVITAELLWNGAIAGRVPVFTLINIAAKTPVTGGSYQGPTVLLTVNDAFVPIFNALFNLRVMSLGMGAGISSISATLGSIP